MKKKKYFARNWLEILGVLKLVIWMSVVSLFESNERSVMIKGKQPPLSVSIQKTL